MRTEIGTDFVTKWGPTHSDKEVVFTIALGEKAKNWENELPPSVKIEKYSTQAFCPSYSE